MTAIYESRERANETAEKLKIFAQPQRLMILSCLLRGERTVGEIEKLTMIGQPALSQQLAELRRAQIVDTRRAAKQIYYRLANEQVVICVKSIEAVFGDDMDAKIASAFSKAGDASEAPRKQDRAGAAAFARIM